MLIGIAVLSLLFTLLVQTEGGRYRRDQFFLAVPVMLGASVLKLVMHHDKLDGRWGLIGVGFVVSFAVALAVVQGAVLVTALIYVIINLAADIAYGLADPKMRKA